MSIYLDLWGSDVLRIYAAYSHYTITDSRRLRPLFRRHRIFPANPPEKKKSGIDGDTGEIDSENSYP